ncbi:MULTISPECIES: N-acetylglucosamine-6-phosphate deacetylase [unclassified Isoptericola]|uniref:N-acetylglucosamine-6-phosphate deacetylase n=1 Tax=unclassified Isoptericola TaxID=2623355 RepID=UPI0027127FE3|nr:MULTISPECIES: amidohydrolase family protein [unclassified Isoptericola]MDO8145630.1 amidohydrolase family protein [Isoptericola sp. 178]MDO8149174.1 amidohydrolase family protein [Isoptericola sp. b515]
MKNDDAGEATADTEVVVGRIVTPTDVIEDGAVQIRDGRIHWCGPRTALPARAGEAPVPDPRPGSTVLPGLVDLHNHGGGGASFPDAATAARARHAVTAHLHQGTTSVVASLVTAPAEVLRERVALLADLADAGEIAGIHLEGPFLSPARRGAQSPRHLRAGDPDLVRALAAAARGHLRTMTVAPEIEGVVGPGGVIETLVDLGILPSIGHTAADTDTTERAISTARAALTAVGRRDSRITATHLFNGMEPLHHRSPGPVAACLAAAARGELVVELVADGVHLAPGMVRAVFDMLECGAARGGATAPSGAIALVTDAMAAAGMADGSYELGPMSVRVVDGAAWLADGSSIAGGTSRLLDVVRSAVAAGADLVAAVRAASSTPADVLGLADVAGIVVGHRADVVVTDGDLRVRRVLRAGNDVLPVQR